ncbi:unnamed protein product [Rodentolepis nana]|uniref:Heat shock 70 kDa protein 4 n=1 Tax=Rodentolepis nana TaxID=102285 RepID=A0A0R3T276_RODNA|nr:unnamed protein product [Rodentolepis nana]
MTSAVVGFDVGSLTSYIGAAKRGGIEILANDVSDRNTPSCVAFNGASRFIGYAAEQQSVTNLSNTVTAFSRLIGKMENDPIINTEREHVFYQIVSDSQGRAAIMVHINGEPTVLLPEQILAMQLHKLTEVAEADLKTKVVDVVLSVPSYYTDRERRAFIDASRIAGLNCTRLVNETTAIGIAYGLTKKELPPLDQQSRNVVFVSLGNSNLQVAVIAFNDGKMRVLSTACDPCLGGRDFDMAIFKHLVKEIREKHKLDVMSNKKARVRLLKACDKLKKVMSTNSTEIPINVECLMEDTDISCKMKREFFESLCESLLLRVKQTMENALVASNLKVEDLHSVELVGGGTRIPAVKSLVKEVFQKDGSTTLNADEAVARGCAFMAAICSPAYKVREFSITDACPYSISLSWTPSLEDVQTAAKDEDPSESALGDSTVVFKQQCPIPATKQLKFYRKSDFTLTASYSNPDGMHIVNPLIGTFRITDVVPSPPDDTAQVRIKMRVNANGIFTISTASVMERVEKEVEVPIEEEQTVKDSGTAAPVPPPSEVKVETNISSQSDKAEPTPAAPAESQPMEADSNEVAPVTAKPNVRIEKKTFLKPRDVPVKSTTMQLSQQQLLEFTDFHAKLNQSDAVERERQHMKNALEEYVYDMRGKLESTLNQFTTDVERESFRRELNAAEEWVYGEGEDAKKSIISKRLEALKQPGDRFMLRFTEFENRTSAINGLTNACEKIQLILESYAAGDDKYEHLAKEEMAKVESSLKDKQKLLHNFMEAIVKMEPTSDPTVFTADLIHAKRDLEVTCNPIISKPKPAPPPPEQTSSPTKEGEGSTNSSDSKEVPNAKASKAGPQSTNTAGEDMDVD